MRVSRILGILLTLLVMMTGPAFAAGTVSLRLSDHQNFVRLVMAWENGDAPDYKINEIDDHTVEVLFTQPGQITPFRPDPAFPEITDVRQVSEADKPLKIWIMLSAGGFERDLLVGSRLILDIDQNKDLRDKAVRTAAAAKEDAAQAPVKAEAAPPVTATDVPAAAPAPKPEVKAVAATPAPANAKVVEPLGAQATPTSAPVSAAVPEPALVAATTPADPTNPPIITLSSTTAFGLASYINNGNLWIVIDQPDFVGTPRVSGQNVEKFSAFERSTTPDATIFHMPLPAGYNILRGEGGDLFWRVVLAAPKPDMPPIGPNRIDDAGHAKLSWPYVQVGKLVSIEDPDTGEKMTVVTVNKSNEFSGPARKFSEFNTPLTGIGLVVIPKVDDLIVTTGKDSVDISRPDGLSLTSAVDAKAYQKTDLPAPPTATQSEQEPHAVITPTPETSASTKVTALPTGANGQLPLYRFDRWAMGGVGSLTNNETALIADLGEKKDDERVGGFMNIGKMYLANARGSEALGYFRLASDSQPAMTDTPEFIGLRGAAYAVNGQFDLAYEDLRNPTLDNYPDINAWRAYTLANLQDWKQAADRIGGDISWVRQYPPAIAQPMILTFGEIALRAGDSAKAEKILNNIDTAAGAPTETDATKIDPYIAERNYLFGEAARQKGKKEDARKYWEELTKSTDDKYRARARLALTILDYEDGKIKIEQAIDQMEGLRYAWRGDEVEASINARLGDIYLDHGDYLKGLNVLRDAATLAPETDMGKRITATMTDAFRSMFLGDRMKKIDPLDAITVYEKFSELVPAGPDANRMTMNLVDRLMEVDLLDRAAKVLQDMIDHRLEGEAKVEASLRLAAVYLLNRQPQQATVTLNKTAEMFGALSDVEMINKRKRELTLLRARALFQGKQIDAALNVLAGLPEDNDVLRSRVDIAWQTGRWGEAASALERLVATAELPSNKPPTPAQAELIRNLAVATNLSGDRGRLAQLREQYGQLMMQSVLAKEFDVITRERQTPTLADRDTLNKLVSEVDMFGTFMNSYRATAKDDIDPAPAVPSVAPPATPAPNTESVPGE